MAFADEGNGSDVALLGKRFSRRFAKAVNEIDDPSRRPGLGDDLVHDFSKENRRKWAPLGRLVDNRASRGERRRDLPGR